MGIERPRGAGVNTLEEALEAAERLGYPVLLRPSYVIGGQNMVIAHEEADVRRYMGIILSGGIANPVLVDKYMPGTELECDVISDGERVLIPGIMEHIERAGIHSGDSIAIYPPKSLSPEMTAHVADCSRRLAPRPRHARAGEYTVPHLRGQALRHRGQPPRLAHHPLSEQGHWRPHGGHPTRVMMGASLEELGCPDGLLPPSPVYGVKAPVFSFEKLPDANSLLGPEMKSTGEVLGVGRTLREATYKALCAAGYTFLSAPGGARRGVLLSVDNRQLGEIGPLVRKLDAENLHMFATPDTANAIKALGCYAFDIGSVTRTADLGGMLERAGIGLVIYSGALHDDTMGDYIELHRQAIRRGILCITSLDTALAAISLLNEHLTPDDTELLDIGTVGRLHQS